MAQASRCTSAAAIDYDPVGKNGQPIPPRCILDWEVCSLNELLSARVESPFSIGWH